MLKREDFTEERIEMLIAEARKHGPFEALTHEERERSRRDFLSNITTADEGLWVFGYGSLLWNPAFDYVASKKAKLFGYRRHFCLHLTMGRGSPDKPGVMLALNNGGSCNGRALLIEPDKIESETRILWMREMLSGAYLPHWGSLQFENGKRVKGLAFVVNRQHSRYIPNLSIEETVKRINQAMVIWEVAGITLKTRSSTWMTFRFRIDTCTRCAKN